MALAPLVPFGLLSDDVLLHLLVKGGLHCVIKASKLDRRMKELCYAELKRRFDQVEFLTLGPFRVGRKRCLELQFGTWVDSVNGALCVDLDLASSQIQIGDEGMKTFCSALSSGALATLQVLDLDSNQIGDEGMKAFSGALSSRALASLKNLYLMGNKIGDEGMKALSTALSSGSLGSLQHLGLDRNQIGDAGMIAFANAIKPTDEIPMGALANLTKLDLTRNKIGDEGMQAFSTAISSGAMGSLQTLYLWGNQIGDSGMIAFADAIKPTDEIPMGSLPALEELFVQYEHMNHTQLVSACKPRGVNIF